MLCLLSIVCSTRLASSIPPSPPFSHTSARAKSAPIFSQKSFTKLVSSSVSVMNLFRVTTTGTPNFWRFSMCFSRFTIPFLRASMSGFDTSLLGTPPLYFRALIVATSTTTSGLSPDILHLISINFSAPRSAPKPASVIQ